MWLRVWLQRLRTEWLLSKAAHHRRVGRERLARPMAHGRMSDLEYQEALARVEQEGHIIALESIRELRRLGQVSDDALRHALLVLPTFRGSWVAADGYRFGDLVLHHGRVWECRVRAVLPGEPPAPGAWLLIIS